MSRIVLSHALYKPGMDLLNASGNEVIIPDNGDSDVIIDELKLADAFILRIGKIDGKAIEACPRLRVITRPGVGVDNVDVKTATANGIPVVICPGSNHVSVAEHTIAFVFALAKDIVEYDNETRKGNFKIRNKYSATEIRGKVISILGFGRIGQEVAKLAVGIGMKVVAYDPFYTKGKVEAMGYGYAATIEEAVSQADYVSLHMPSLDTTRNMVNKEFLAAMKPTAFLINCARGDIVDEAALYEALVNHVIAGAALDVLSKEPMDAEDPIMKLPNLIISPHSAAQTQESTTNVVTLAVQGTLAVLEGKEWPNVCNPEVYQTEAWKKKIADK